MIALALALSLATQDLGQSLHGVVLLVTQLEDGYASYGSGIVVDLDGNVLTNLHVLEGAKSVHALTYDPEHPSYSALDGGLARLVFEREKELIPVRFVRGDPVLDLAVVRFERPARILPLPFAKGQVAIGEPVSALGHPEQNFWTVTRGQVSGLHQGSIQHDAAVNKGNSGGPLLNGKGEVVGINTSFVKGAQGISYARPVALAAKLLDNVQAPVVLERSTPEKALVSCMHARELGDPSYSQCVNWGSHYALFREAVDAYLSGQVRVTSVFGDDGKPDFCKDWRSGPVTGGPQARPREAIRGWLERGDGRADLWVKHYGPFLLTFVLSDDPVEQGRAFDRFLAYVQDGSRGGRPPKVPPTPSPMRAMPREKLALQMEKTEINVAGADAGRPNPRDPSGLKIAAADVNGMRKVLKMGLRVDEVRPSGTTHSWASLSGRNFDGTPYRYSVLLVKAPDGWRDVEFVTPDDERTHPLPKGFPEPIALGLLPTLLSIGLGAGLLGMQTWADDPEGVRCDFDFEHLWPAYLQAIKNKSTKEGALVARTLEQALKK